jgi:hypothetical protein
MSNLKECELCGVIGRLHTIKRVSMCCSCCVKALEKIATNELQIRKLKGIL